MSTELFLDYLSVRLNREKAGNAAAVLNVDFGAKDGAYKVELANGVLNHSKGVKDPKADANVSMSRDTLNKLLAQQVKFDDALSSGEIKVTGNADKLKEIVSYLDNFEFWFNVVTP